MSKLYKMSGVDIEQSNILTHKIQSKTQLANIGRFSALCELPMSDYLLVTTVDGIGTKILPLLEKKDYKTIANDVIAMNLNDLACSGARAVSFSDYIALNTIDPEAISEIVKELALQLKKYNCQLSSGETSEMKSLIPINKMDIAGFAVGLVKRENLLPSDDIDEGDLIIGLKSNGVHANGFSLIRKLVAEKKLDEKDFEIALRPTTIYLNEIVKLAENHLIKSAANITGGGISNIERALPKGFSYHVDLDTIPEQAIFKKLYNLCGDECYEVFNMGVGFCVVVAPEKSEKAIEKLAQYSPFIFGEVIKK